MSDDLDPRGVSVVIPTCNRPQFLLNTTYDFLQQDFADMELIIVDQSEEVNCEVLSLLSESSMPTRYFKAKFRGVSQARNFGWRQARKGIVLYVDDDIRCDASFVRSHVAAHRRTGAMLVGGGIEEVGLPITNALPGSMNWWFAEPIANFGAMREGACIHVAGGNFSMDRKAVELAGGFDEHFAIGAALYEETEFALRVNKKGGLAWFAPSVRLQHLKAPSGGNRVQNDWPRYMYGLAHNRTILIYRYLRWWHRPTAILRLLTLGLSYSRLDKTIQPFLATFRGIAVGQRVARMPPLHADLHATEHSAC